MTALEAKEEELIVEWTFSPPDFFQESKTLNHKGYALNIFNGRVEARTTGSGLKNHSNNVQELDEWLSSLFLGAQLEVRKRYILSKPSHTLLRANGSRIFNVTVSDGIRIGGSADIVLKSKGVIVYDSRQERSDRQWKGGLLAAKHRNDKLADFILTSYSKAMNNRDKRLFYLFEVVEALSKHFRGREEALKVLGLNGKAWKKKCDRLGILANKEPLKESRHAGKHFDEFREAKGNELNEAEGIARDLIFAYLEYREKISST